MHKIKAGDYYRTTTKSERRHLTMAVKYLKLDEEFKGYTLYYHDPVLPDGPNWVLEDEVGLVCADDTWPYLLWEPGTSDDDVEYFERLAAHCDECFNRRLGEECDPEEQMGAEVFGLARDEWGWVKEEEEEEEDEEEVVD